jgi:hypothetical protein
MLTPALKHSFKTYQSGETIGLSSAYCNISSEMSGYIGF